MNRLTNKDDRGRYYTVEEKILIANEPVNPTTTWIVHNENRRYGSPIEKLGKLEDLLQSYNVKDLEELDKLLKIVTTCKELSKQLGFPLPLFKKVLDSGIWVKDKDRFYHLDTLEINVKIEDDGFVIEELYFEDLDGVMDTTGFKVYSQDYKKTWFLKEDKSE